MILTIHIITDRVWSSNFGYYHSKSIIHAMIHASESFNSNKYLSNVFPSVPFPVPTPIVLIQFKPKLKDLV